MSPSRPKQDPIVYLQRDIEAMKHTLDKILRPYKADVRHLRAENVSLRAGIARKDKDIEGLMFLVAQFAPGKLDDALAILCDTDRKGWKKFRANWLQRLGLEAEDPR